MATRDQVEELLRQGHGYESAARELGIRPGLAHMIATGHPADTGEPSAPTRSAPLMEWVRTRAHHDLEPASEGSR